ncbi:MAG: UPF0182 family protein [Acidimicrobiia bacterium]|nr:UPF0182 family protein [Acidimicrobiia bacterium]
MISNAPPQNATPRRANLIVIAVVLFVAYEVLRRSATFWTDYLWFESVNLTSVWWTLNGSRLILGAIGFVLSFLILYSNLYAAERISPRFDLLVIDGQDEMVERFNDWLEPRLRRILLIVAAVFALLSAGTTMDWALPALQFLNPSSFGLVDPVFGNDVSLYVFQLPFMRMVNAWLFTQLVIALIVVAVLHYLNGGIKLLPDRPPEVRPGVKSHVSVIMAALAFTKSWGYLLDSYDLLDAPGEPYRGAFFTDVNAQIPANRLLAIVALVAGFIFLANIWQKRWLLPAVAGGGWLVVALIVGVAYPQIVERFQVSPNFITQETPYAERHMEFTKVGFDLADIEILEFPASNSLTADDLPKNLDTLENLRLWDPVVLASTYRSSQELRPYYEFDDIDVDRYELDGRLTQVELGVREMVADEQSSGWVNEHLVFTHGFGVVISPANDVTDQGKPDYLVKDIPPLSLVPELEVDEPRIYFGELLEPGSFVYANTDEREVDPDPEFSSYEGEGGIRLGGFFRRLAFALRFTDFNTLISGQIDGESQVMMRRNILDMVATTAPFLRTDSDPYMVVVDGNLQWVIDMYSVSDSFPYSQTASTGRLPAVSRDFPGLPLPTRFNYVRNSVKAVVDAYEGTMTFYVVDDADPIIQSWVEVFPDMFTDQADMPDGLRTHLRYPEDLFRVQSDMYELYHVDEVRELLENSDPWAVATDPSTSELQVTRFLSQFTPGEQANQVRTMLPYYLLMKLPGEDELSFLIMQPFVPENKENMISFLIAKSDPDSYGEFIDFRLPPNEQFDGPGLIGKDINQDSDYSALRTLLGQEGSTIIQGQMLVVPIEESILFVQPIYLQGDGENTIPEFKRVAMVYDNRIAIGETLDQALQLTFPGFAAGVDLDPITDIPVGELPTEVAELVAAADAALDEAQRALIAGDLGTYQAKVDEARDLITEALVKLAETATP